MNKGERIRTLRENAGLSQVSLADKISVSKQTLYKYENNIITNIPSDKIEAIARVTGSTPAYIMGWNEECVNLRSSKIQRTLLPDEAALLDDYQKLNTLGKEKARGDVADLTEIPKYTDKGERSSLSDVG